jgi:hypothetical protein
VCKGIPPKFISANVLTGSPDPVSFCPKMHGSE